MQIPVFPAAFQKKFESNRQKMEWCRELSLQCVCRGNRKDSCVLVMQAVEATLAGVCMFPSP